MKVLIVHNRHRVGSASGDETVVNNEINLLCQRGNTVLTYIKHNTDFEKKNVLAKLWNTAQIPWSWENYKKIKKIIRKENPDAVHIHTFFPFLSSSVYIAAYEMGKPIVQTLHDFRFFCPKAYFFNNCEICEECLDSGLYKSVVRRCFHNSIAKSTVAAATVYLCQKMKIFDKINAFITFTEFGRNKFSQLGIPKNKIFIKPHFLFHKNIDVNKNQNEREKYFLFVGRLSEEKGIKFLLDAWGRLPGISLKIAGSGVLSDWVQKKIMGMPNVQFIGFIPHDNIAHVLSNAYAVIIPSILYETFAIVIIEAYSAGTPVIASKLGAMADLVINNKTGILFDSNNKEDLISKVVWLWNNNVEREKMGNNAREEFKEKYTAEKNYQMFMKIYESAIAMQRRAP